MTKTFEVYNVRAGSFDIVPAMEKRPNDPVHNRIAGVFNKILELFSENLTVWKQGFEILGQIGTYEAKKALETLYKWIPDYSPLGIQQRMAISERHWVWGLEDLRAMGYEDYARILERKPYSKRPPKVMIL